MKIQVHQFRLPLAHPFTIARGTITEQITLVVELEHKGLHGFGEVSENSYYKHSYAELKSSLEKVTTLVPSLLEMSSEEFWQSASDAMAGDMFALSALDMAAHDLRAQMAGVPTWKAWGLDWENVPNSSYTIGIDSIERMVAKLQERPGWDCYKIKLGTDKDIEIVRELRRNTEATFRVDANCGWTARQTIENSGVLRDLGVEFIEQPLPADAPESDKLAVYEQSALPVIADESCIVREDVARCHGLFHGINVKICKCGGLTPALAMLRQARQLVMKTMVGCMIESSIGISGAAQLLPLLDYADLDGAILISEDPAVGATLELGRVVLPSRNGNGAMPRWAESKIHA